MRAVSVTVAVMDRASGPRRGRQGSEGVPAGSRSRPSRSGFGLSHAQGSSLDCLQVGTRPSAMGPLPPFGAPFAALAGAGLTLQSSILRTEPPRRADKSAEATDRKRFFVCLFFFCNLTTKFVCHSLTPEAIRPLLHIPGSDYLHN